MAFWGHSFVYAGVPCEDFDLMLYDINGNSQGATNFGKVDILEDSVNSRHKPYFYGVVKNGRLEFSLIFGVNVDRLDKEKYLDRSEMEAVAHWLMGQTNYQYLEIEQEDMEYARYKCLITGIEMIEYASVPWALKATVSCDSNYGYLYPQDYSYTATGSTPSAIVFYNECTAYEYYKPRITFTRQSGSGTWNVSVMNESDNNRVCSFVNIPYSVSTFTVDCQTGVITSDDNDVNMYEYSNFKFLRLKSGMNKLDFSGSTGKTVEMTIHCEFPIIIGG